MQGVPLSGKPGISGKVREFKNDSGKPGIVREFNILKIPTFLYRTTAVAVIAQKQKETASVELHAVYNT